MKESERKGYKWRREENKSTKSRRTRTRRKGREGKGREGKEAVWHMGSHKLV